MKKLFTKLKRTRRAGMTMVELLGVMAIIVIISAIAVGGISAARDTANTTSTNSDLRTYSTAIQQVLVSHPEIMKFTKDRPDKATELVVKYINDQLEDQWEFELLANATDSGGIAGTKIKRDAWNNAYGLYVYFDDLAPTYTDATGTSLVTSDSCVYIVVASAGKNGTGGPTGYDGNNFDLADRSLLNASAMVNNTDGVDDMGVIVRILNGDTRAASYGLDSSNLGDLVGKQWIFGKHSASGGVVYDFVNGTGDGLAVTAGGSLDKYYDKNAVNASNLTLFGDW